MRIVSLENIESGMILGRDIYTIDGTILLSKGVKLTDYYIKRLKELAISHIYINDEISKDIEITDIISDKTRIAAKKTLMQSINELQTKKSLNVQKIKSVVNDIVDELLSNNNIVINLSDLRTVDEYTFAHSVNVAVLSIVIGKALGLNELRLRDLGIGAILHDIGKVQIPNEILNKPSKLNDEEIIIMKNHTMLGYKILKDFDDISSLSRIVPLLHHERIDGSGYPYGKKGNDIHLFAKIVAVADTYDAMTSNRVYKKKSSNREVIEYLISTSHHNFEYEIVKLFLEHVTVYPVGTIVRLNTNQKAIVVDNNKDYPTRPIVRVIPDGKDKNLCNFEEIDLQKKLTVFIEEICDE